MYAEHTSVKINDTQTAINFDKLIKYIPAYLRLSGRQIQHPRCSIQSKMACLCVLEKHVIFHIGETR